MLSPVKESQGLANIMVALRTRICLVRCTKEFKENFMEISWTQIVSVYLLFMDAFACNLCMYIPGKSCSGYFPFFFGKRKKLFTDNMKRKKNV